jgi:2-polyprenyl-3-methyl-5-hydroxy-6-metoxy-1,4-benzoquinol methylase
MFLPHKHALGYVEAVPKPSADELDEFYSRRYFQEDFGDYAPIYGDDELLNFTLTAEVARRITERMSSEKFLIDLGSGEGYFAAACHSAGWKVRCFDLSSYGIERHNPHLLEYYRQFDISKIQQSDFEGTPGLVNLANVLEHVIDPIALLKQLCSMIAGSSTILRIVVPNDYSDFQIYLLKNKLTNNTWFVPPEHLSYFNSQSLKNLLNECSLKILSLQADFPIEVFLANPNSNYVEQPNLGKGAHNARIAIQNFLIQTNLNDYIDYSESAGKLGFGRDLIIYAYA